MKPFTEPWRKRLPPSRLRRATPSRRETLSFTAKRGLSQIRIFRREMESNHRRGGIIAARGRQLRRPYGDEDSFSARIIHFETAPGAQRLRESTHNPTAKREGSTMNPTNNRRGTDAAPLRLSSACATRTVCRTFSGNRPSKWALRTGSPAGNRSLRRS